MFNQFAVFWNTFTIITENPSRDSLCSKHFRFVHFSLFDHADIGMRAKAFKHTKWKRMQATQATQEKKRFLELPEHQNNHGS